MVVVGAVRRLIKFGDVLMANKKLTPKQQKFCEEYAASGNGTLAAIRAGYPERSARSIANENLTKPDIIAEIKRLSQREKHYRIMNIDERQVLLTQIANNGEDLNAAIRAIDTLNKMDGLYIQKHEVQVTRSLADIIKEIDNDADTG